MQDVLGYQGKNVVITGAASGMGQAAAQLLVDVGAQVYALDIAPVSVPVKQAIKTDMKDRASLDAAIAANRWFAGVLGRELPSAVARAA